MKRQNKIEQIAKSLSEIKAAIKRRFNSKCPCVALKMDCNACDGCDKFSDREEK